MKLFFLIFSLFLNYLSAFENLSPTYSLKASGAVQSIFYKENKLFSGNDMGSIEIFDTISKKLIKKIELPKIKDFIGDEIASKIYSIDIIKNKILITAQGEKGYANLYLFEDDKLHKIINLSKKYYIKKALFVDNDLIILGLLSDRIILYDLKKNKELYNVQVNYSSFSDMMLSEDKKSLAFTDESGVVIIVDTMNAKIKSTLKAQNVDKVFQIDYKNGIILTAGRDRRAAIYSKNENYYNQYDFLLYSCGLSPSASLAAVAYNENNEVVIYNVKNKKELYNLKGQDSTLTKILFINENELFISSDSKIINFWKLN